MRRERDATHRSVIFHGTRARVLRVRADAD